VKNNVQVLTRTAVLIALTLVFQNLRLIPIIGTGPHSQYIVGSLVNAALIVAVGTVNIYAAVTIGVIAPVVAFIQGQLPPLLPYMIPIVAVGNIVYVLLYYVLNKKNTWAGIIVGAVAKFVFLFLAVRIMLHAVKGKLPENVFGKISATLSAGFSWPQLITALIGGFIAITVIKAVNKVQK